MSQSPLEQDGEREDYRSGWFATWSLVRQGKSWSGYERDCCFLNLGDGTFADVSAVSGLDARIDGRAVAVVDWDRDGRLDCFVSGRGPPRLAFHRNAWRSGGGSVSLKLQGAGANRDAIGARVELSTREHPSPPRVRCVSAGDGYLSQSSRWVHVGLGSDRTIESVEVRWPDGARERFEGVEPGGRWLLEEGEGRARPFPEPPPPPPLAAGPLPVESRPSTRRIVLAAPLPIEAFPYVAEDGSPRAVSARGSEALLVCLWTSDCPGCRRELAALAQRAGELRARGVRVLALTVDGPAERPAASEILRALDWDFESGEAPEDLVRAIVAVLEEVLEIHGSMVLPTSFLVDSRDRLTVVYRGPADPEQILADVAMPPSDPETERARATPFRGRWIAPPVPPPLLTLAESFSRRGDPVRAQAYLLRVASIPGFGDEAASHFRARQQRAQYAVGVSLAAEGRHAEAVEAFRTTIEEEPGNANAHLKLGLSLRALGRGDEALAAVQEAVRLEPRNAAARSGLGVLLLDRGQRIAAEREFEAATDADPESASAWYNLGFSRLARGAFAAAVDPLRRACELDPESFDSRLMLGSAMHQGGRLDEALGVYREAVALSPGDARGHYNLGRALLDRGDLEGAREELARLRELDAGRARNLEARIAGREE